MPRAAAEAVGSRVALEAVAVGALALAVYASGASPGIYVGDSGELVTAAATLGIPHPSGYPLYVLLGWIWTQVFGAGSVAWRMSVFSAVAGAASVALAYGWLRRRGSAATAVLGAGLLALGPSFWSQANIPRVYTLNCLFVLAVVVAADHWRRSGRDSSLVAAFALAGLGASNHTFLVLEAAALALWALACEPGWLSRPLALVRRGATCASAFVLGLAPYAYLPIRSAADPLLDWGDPETPGRFFAVVARQDFWDRAWLQTPSDMLLVLADWGGSLFVEGAPWLGLAALLAWRRCGAVVWLALAVAAVNVVAVGLHGSRSDIFLWHRYYIPSYAMSALLAGLGAQVIEARIPRPARWPLVLAGLAVLGASWADFDRSRYHIAEDFAEAVLESVPPGAHLIATDDNVLFVLIYLQFVEGRRPDVNLILQGVGEARLPDLRFDPDSDPVYFTHHPNWDYPGLEIVPTGVAFRAWRHGRPWPPPVFPRERADGSARLAGEDDPRVPRDYLTENLLGHFHYTRGFAYERRDWPRARREFREAAAAAPRNDVLFYNLGLLYARNGLYEDAAAAFQRSHSINPRHLASASRPRASEKLRATRAELERISALEAVLAAGLDETAGSAAWHRAMAGELVAAGEALRARAHELRVLETVAPSGYTR